MTDLRSGLCHGPNCTATITDRSPSPDFCRDECQTAWHASHADPPMPPVSIHLPAPSLARWTPEGGVPVTPETSTWTPQPDDLEQYQAAVDRAVDEVARQAQVPPALLRGYPGSSRGGWVQLDDSDHPDWVWRADVTERIRRASTAELFEALRTCKLKVKRSAEVGEAATQSPTQERSWLSRLRGWLRG